MDQNVVKLDHFDGINFSRWMDKLMFMLTALKIAYVLDPILKDLPESKDDDSNQLKAEQKKRVDDEVLCKGHILNTLSDRLYDLFTNVQSPKEIWKALEFKYMLENKGQIMNYADEKKPNLGGKKYSGESSSGGKKRKLQEFFDSNATKTKTNKSYEECQCWQKMKNVNAANLVEQENVLVAMISDLHIGMITELNMTAKVIKGYKVMMENNDTTKVLGKNTVEISFTFGKKLVLVNVLFVPEIRKNLVSLNLLCKKGIKAVLDSDKVVFSKNGAFVGKGYSCDGMFKLNIINKMNDASAYVVGSSSFSLWHSILTHVNFGYIKYISKHGLISCNDTSNDKCEICIQAKMTKKPF
ncbi:hypothetical protein NE237_010363 [Protea cynaroides]|uniref:GAG-pre-integrase domain-containing protein n=1 Tax=Protea cynaroides TaxID=273540 RepID=A0A9Q0KZ62_9MAGN|nr:hypothetical protein NE237_010363 [Protea cynaroides]